MAWDLCLGFCEKPLPTDFWTQQTILKESPANSIYLFTSEGGPLSGGRPFFGFWSDEWFDLAALSTEASRACGRLCLSWKLEHSGSGGYQIYSDGQRVKEERSQNPDFVLYPAEGVEKTFRRFLQFSEEDDRVCFPEILLEETTVRCSRVLRDNGRIELVEAPDAPREKMFHYGLDVEPVLPFNTFS
jgi:hypothetical protein